MAVIATQINKTVADPIAAYESILPIWKRNRAICGGERAAKEHDASLDTISFSNLLIPFSKSMSAEQYAFYKAEAELPGIVAQYKRILIGGLLRKKPQLELPEGVPEDAYNWIMNEFDHDDASLSAFLDRALDEELETSRTFVLVDYPAVPEAEAMTKEELLQFKPYPILWKAESVINWSYEQDDVTGKSRLTRIIVRKAEEVSDPEINEFHPTYVSTVYVHDLDEDGFYRIRTYRAKNAEASVVVINGRIVHNTANSTSEHVLIDEKTDIVMSGERLRFIPVWPLNGSIDAIVPFLSTLVDKEVNLYNKVSRRNHLLYGAATYTPYVASDMPEEDFEDIVKAGLGSWLRVNQGDTVGVLEPPTAALQDMDRAIESAVAEIARLGVRMLAPEVADQSGVALELRNAAQTAQLSTLNMKISSQMADIIAFMLNWRYGLNLVAGDISFSMSSDFNPTPLGEAWLRLITEWYQAKLLSRQVWLEVLKQNDILPPDYDDAVGISQITNDELSTELEQQQMDNYLRMNAEGA